MSNSRSNKWKATWEKKSVLEKDAIRANRKITKELKRRKKRIKRILELREKHKGHPEYDTPDVIALNDEIIEEHKEYINVYGD